MNTKAAKPAAAPKKRGPASKQQNQKLLTEMLKPAEDSGISPEKKVRKMRASPFNKKSGSILGRAASKSNETTEVAEKSSFAGSSNSVEEPVVDAPRTRPQRANRKLATVVLSDSESENVSSDDDFDFDEEED